MTRPWIACTWQHVMAKEYTSNSFFFFFLVFKDLKRGFFVHELLVISSIPRHRGFGVHEDSQEIIEMCCATLRNI